MGCVQARWFSTPLLILRPNFFYQELLVQCGVALSCIYYRLHPVAIAGKVGHTMSDRRNVSKLYNGKRIYNGNFPSQMAKKIITFSLFRVYDIMGTSRSSIILMMRLLMKEKMSLAQMMLCTNSESSSRSHAFGRKNEDVWKLA